MKIPESLKLGGTIGFAAPSFGCNIEPYKTAFNNALKTFEKMGYKTKLGQNCYAGDGIGISNTPLKCAKEINSFLCGEYNEEISALFSCGGGELMCEILDDVDFDKIKKSKPVWFLGYSDNTNLTFLLPTICDITAIYSPCAPAYGMEPWHPSLKDTFELLTGKSNMAHGYDKWEKESLKNEENPLVPYNVTKKTEIKKFGAGKDDAKTEISGRLIGGCLDCLSNLAGTKFDKVSDFNEKYKEDGIIWFMESCDLNPMAIRRAIWQLDHAGWFKYVKGFLIRRPLCLDEEILGVDRYNAVYPLLEKYNVPIIMDLDIGHTAPMMPIVSGAKAEIVVEKNSIKIHYKELEV